MARKRSKPAGTPSTRGPGSRRSAAPDAGQQAAMAAVRQAIEQLNRGDVRGATVTVQQGLRGAPEHPELLHLAGQAALRLGDVSGGKGLIQRAIKIAPKVALYHYNLGSVQLAGNDLDGALKSFRQAVRLDPKFVDAFTNLGLVFVQKRQPEDALLAFEAAARLQPRNPQLHLNLAVCNLELRNPERAEEAVMTAESLLGQPDLKQLHEIGNIYRGLRRHQRAEEYYRRALQIKPELPELWFALADVLSQASEHEKAFEALQKARALGFDSGLITIALAHVAASLGDVPNARQLLAEAAEIVGDNVVRINNIAHEYSLIGDFDAQLQCLNRVRQLDPDNVDAFVSMVAAPGRSVSEEDARRLRGLADDSGVDASTRCLIGFALGDHYRHAKRYDDSFRYYRLGNRMKGYRFDLAAYSRWVDQTVGCFTREFFAGRAGWGSDSRMPVLIVGMPRSGTTLTEQILSSHPEVFGAGECGRVASLASVPGLPDAGSRIQPEFLAGLSEQAAARHASSYLHKMEVLAEHGERFVTNKLPHNFEQLGLFGVLFPQAPVIHIKRDPRDNLLSIYFQHFRDSHEYAYDLKTLGHYYRLYERLAAHWAEVIPNPVFTLRYEDLVADLPGKSRELADFVGVEWDERMTRFYEQERAVSTASKWQVRQPLYTSSVARWKPYERHLKPLFEALGPIDT